MQKEDGDGKVPADTVYEGARYVDVVSRIREMIIDGDLPPGSRIPEKELCAKFGISRTPLREALKMLSAEGHIVLLPNRGARVVDLTPQEVAELYEVTGALEALAGELACERITPEELEEIRAHHERMVACFEQEDMKGYYACNRAIHERIMAASRNSELIALYSTVNARIRRARFVIAMPRGRWSEAMAEHEGMVNALVRKDGVTLGRILRMHLRHKG
ncbi:GntR family transcriptional regulator [Paraburkholderia silviterrae]|uniref:GntR family transcriptional regulator n=1 Tax=Paraburkholderia silviterrae TaxID=2528715 RepID=A0A4R5M9B8_9BURK|nr:GntR family transcriptional regulator [Paraburkholderia silviterrae]TDG22763.1 GntR family transcriptional regulator [Paraburkholderia silviterrae]